VNARAWGLAGPSIAAPRAGAAPCRGWEAGGAGRGRPPRGGRGSHLALHPRLALVRLQQLLQRPKGLGGPLAALHQGRQLRGLGLGSGGGAKRGGWRALWQGPIQLGLVPCWGRHAASGSLAHTCSALHSASRSAAAAAAAAFLPKGPLPFGLPGPAPPAGASAGFAAIMASASAPSWSVVATSCSNAALRRWQARGWSTL
jgi:hypothetical protein